MCMYIQTVYISIYVYIPGMHSFFRVAALATPASSGPWILEGFHPCWRGLHEASSPEQVKDLDNIFIYR